MAIPRVPSFRVPQTARQRARAVLMVLPWLLGSAPAAAQMAPPLAPGEQTVPLSAPQAQLPPPAAPQLPAPEPEHPPTRRYEVGFQSTVIGQNLFKFRSPYQGKDSLHSQKELKTTDTYTLYLGARPSARVELYVNPELSRGQGIGGAVGLGGYTNGEVIRLPTLSKGPYFARYFLRWTVPTGGGTEQAEAEENQIPGPRPAHRLVVTAGKLATVDLFDLNSYAGNTRTQFMNWALITNAAYDFAADTRGYSLGLAIEWAHPDWAVRLGSFQMPTVANGPNLAGDLIHNRGDQIEGELHPRLMGAHRAPLIVRLLGYRNVAHMGNYRAALARARQTGKTPDITAVEKRGAVKYGYGLNVEQALGDDGATGVFGRWGWNDGATETFAFTECDRTLCLGGQLSGARWHSPRDRVALALVQNGLSPAHRDYLAAGGHGFQLGDGRLHYGPEEILESYYAHPISRLLTLTLDYQLIGHPGYNRDRGPVSVLSLRLHLEY